jgi:hypothetical protein
MAPLHGNASSIDGTGMSGDSVCGSIGRQTSQDTLGNGSTDLQNPSDTLSYADAILKYGKHVAGNVQEFPQPDGNIVSSLMVTTSETHSNVNNSNYNAGHTQNLGGSSSKLCATVSSIAGNSQAENACLMQVTPDGNNLQEFPQPHGNIISSLQGPYSSSTAGTVESDKTHRLEDTRQEFPRPDRNIITSLVGPATGDPCYVSFCFGYPLTFFASGSSFESESESRINDKTKLFFLDS